jgi:hypothetical protein
MSKLEKLTHVQYLDNFGKEVKDNKVKFAY